jgi:methionine-rich copper-binding protein CopC
MGRSPLGWAGVCPRVRRNRGRVVVSVVVAGFAVLGLATPAFAHNVLVGSSPVAGATLSTGPAEVRFDFNAPVRDGPNTITVVGPDGTHWERTENATVTGNSVSTAVAPLGAAGVYTASYRIISADGHPVTGEIRFTLTIAGHGTPAPTAVAATASGSGGGGGVPIWVWIVGAAVLLGVVLWLALRTSRGSEDRS